MKCKTIVEKIVYFSIKENCRYSDFSINNKKIKGAKMRYNGSEKRL